MLRSEASKVAIFATVCLIDVGTTVLAKANAIMWVGDQPVYLDGLPGAVATSAFGINDIGQAVGDSLGSSPGTGPVSAVEWSGGGVIYLGSTGTALSINNVGQVVGIGPFGATEWSGGQVITLGGLAGSYVQGSVAYSINDSGQAVGYNVFKHEGIDHASAVEWSGGEVVDLGSLHGTPDSGAYAINDAGQVVGVSSGEAVEWSSGQIIDLGPGVAYAINDAGQMVGARWTLGESEAVEWSGGQVIDLQEPPGTLDTIATGINNAGQVVGVSSSNAPEPSTWAMLLLGFTGLGFAGYRRVKVGATVGGDRGLMRRSGSTRSTNTRLPVVRIA